LTRKESQARTRRLLLEVAAEEFLRRGYSATSLERIAETAGFSKGAVYGSFASKEEMCLAVLESHYVGQLEVFIGEFMGGGGTIDDRLAVIERWWDLILADEAWQLLAIEFAAQARHNPAVQHRLAQHQRLVRAAVTGLLQQQISQLGLTPILPPDELAMAFIAVVGGISVQRLIDPEIPASVLTNAVKALLLGRNPA
jgi:AcrR family transcriptional regulator